jgi:hypothetical protein
MELGTPSGELTMNEKSYRKLAGSIKQECAQKNDDHDNNYREYTDYQKDDPWEYSDDVASNQGDCDAEYYEEYSEQSMLRSIYERAAAEDDAKQLDQDEYLLGILSRARRQSIIRESSQQKYDDDIKILKESLVRIRRIKSLVGRLQTREVECRNKVMEILANNNISKAKVTLGDTNVHLSVRNTTNVRYDEKTLQDRLGGKIKSILEPYAPLMKKHFPQIREALGPVIEKIGRITPRAIDLAIQAGEISADDVAGAFESTQKDILYIRIVDTPDKKALG